MITRPRTGQDTKYNSRGFTLVELLIVVAILALLTAVVIPSVTGMFGRGAAQAYETDTDNLRSAVALFFYDSHACDTSDAWNSSATNVIAGHYHPTASATLPTGSLQDILDDANSTGAGHTFSDSAIWLSLLCNTPSDSSAHDIDTACPLKGEAGPYVNKMPDSASRNNYSTATGSYTWILAADGNVYGVYWNGSAWQSDCSGSYP